MLLDADRFWSFVDRSGDCWMWIGNGSDYGIYTEQGKPFPAHRVAVMLATGSFPLPGLVVHHVCNNKRCVNPKHLRVVSYSENSRAIWDDGIRQRRGDPRPARPRKIRPEPESPPIDPAHQFLRPDEAARRLGITVPLLREWVANGYIPGYKLGSQMLRIRESDVIAFIAANSTML